jgi:2,3-bisphosphoglycerate-dependent phosphoglycerate mutase
VELLLIRHGRPARVEGSDDGPADPPLTELGLEQAEAMASWVADEGGVDAIYASPLRRAQQTAEPLAAKLGLDIRLDASIQEYDANSTSYIPLEDLQAAGDVRAAELPEDPAAFQKLVVDGIEQIISRHTSGRLALVCHGGVINVYTAWVLSAPKELYFYPQYTSISRVLAGREGQRYLASLNEHAHLRVAGVAHAELS